MADISPVKKSFLSRKSFLLILAGLAGLAIPLRYYFKSRKHIITGKIIGASHQIGHKLRGGTMPAPTVTSEVDVLIVGSGISGLSAGRWLKKNNIHSFKILELDKNAGGNAAFGENSISSYPWGAHYLPIPNADQPELLEFLEEHKVITGYEKGLPVYNEYYLCHDPEERLYINGHWQEGLIPSFGVPEKDKEQIHLFLQKMEEFRKARGRDGKQAFAIPLDRSSQDERYRIFDKQNFKEYLLENKFDSPYLLWYADYCCRDDYGTRVEETSAWAGLHYFASRKGKAANAEHSDVLTWPNGNGWLSERMQEFLKGHIETGKLAYSISVQEDKVQVDTYNTATHQTERILAKQCIMATPQYVNRHIIKTEPTSDKNYFDAFSYAPWMVANLHVQGDLSRGGVPLCWDNVLYNRPSLGYINANHQHLNLHASDKMITFYFPLTQQDPVEARKISLEKTHEQWVSEIVRELEPAHPNLEAYIQSADIWVWGHGMIRPTPGFIWGKERRMAQQPLSDKIFFAHTDLSGISIFEEAFYQGLSAAEQVMNSTNKV